MPFLYTLLDQRMQVDLFVLAEASDTAVGKLVADINDIYDV